MRQLLWTGIIMLTWSFSSCNENSGGEAIDRFDSGTLYISCDESFKPAIDAQIQVYRHDFPKANIVVAYKPEADCLRDMLNDSVQMVIATREASPRESQLISDSLKLATKSLTVAYDAIAVIVHPKGTDSFFTIQEIRNLLTGKSKKALIPVMDGLKATSTVRFMIDSVLKGEPLGSHVTAAKNSVEVIEYVARTPSAVGFIGTEWIGNADDTTQLGFLKKVKLARLESTDSVGGFVLPVQYLIYTKTYPLIRDLVYVLKEKHTGIGNAFATFLRGQKGQLIFRRSYLFPALYPYYLRDAQLE